MAVEAPVERRWLAENELVGLRFLFFPEDSDRIWPNV